MIYVLQSFVKSYIRTQNSVIRSELFNVAVKIYPVYDMVARRVYHRFSHKAVECYTFLEVCKQFKNFGKKFALIRPKETLKFSNYI